MHPNRKKTTSKNHKKRQHNLTGLETNSFNTLFSLSFSISAVVSLVSSTSLSIIIPKENEIVVFAASISFSISFINSVIFETDGTLTFNCFSSTILSLLNTVSFKNSIFFELMSFLMASMVDKSCQWAVAVSHSCCDI